MSRTAAAVKDETEAMQQDEVDAHLLIRSRTFEKISAIP